MSKLAAVLALCALVGAEEPCRGDSCMKEEQADSAMLQMNRQARSNRQPLSPERAMQKRGVRTPLAIESDLEEVVKQQHATKDKGFEAPSHKKGRSALACQAFAGHTFQKVVHSTGIAAELTKRELSDYESRFSAEIVPTCQNAGTHAQWMSAVGRVMQRQKPLLTAAFVDSVHKAGLGFDAALHKWLVPETQNTKEKHLGLKPSVGKESVLRRKPGRAEGADALPEAFRAEEKWPMCEEAILRIHDQGHCGSCWVFSALAPVDARMCIVSNGTWSSSKHTLSRLQATSCAAGISSYDGCMGGEPYWVLTMMAEQGVVSSNCLPYMITGSGVEHFEESNRAPSCVSHCQQTYDKTLEEDAFISPGVGNFDFLTDVHGEAGAIYMAKMAMYTEGPVSFAFKVIDEFFAFAGGVFSLCDGTEVANHAVHAFGWGKYSDVEGGEAVDYFEAVNSWGVDWGVNGTFRLHPTCICEVTIPGAIEASTMNHAVEDTNELWPWGQIDECPVDADGCVTDMEGPENYTTAEFCKSSALNGKMVRVEEFDTEYSYDLVKINGYRFSGTPEVGLDVELMSMIIVDDNGLTFQADGSIEGAGFKLCPMEVPPATECPVDANGCVTDLEGGENYVELERCVSSALNGKRIRVEVFDTEFYYDVVKINGHQFSGSVVNGNLDMELLTSLVVDDDGIAFSSDASEVAPGFKLCPADDGEPVPQNDTTDSANQPTNAQTNAQTKASTKPSTINQDEWWMCVQRCYLHYDDEEFCYDWCNQSWDDLDSLRDVLPSGAPYLR